MISDVMKIVVNRCYGGFDLSPIAIQEYLKRKGKKAFFYVQIPIYGSLNEKYERKEANDIGDVLCLHVMLKDLGKTATKLSDEDYFSINYIERNDKDLVAVVEELKDKANTRFSELEVVEIPDDVEFEIEEYDGKEWVSEKHRRW